MEYSIVALDAKGLVVKNASRTYKPERDGGSLNERIAYCVKRGGKQAVRFEVFDEAHNLVDTVDGERLDTFRGVGKFVEKKIKEMKAPVEAYKKGKKKPKPKTKSEALPGRVGVISAIFDMLGTKNKDHAEGWTAQEIATAVAAKFDRPAEGVLTTVRCQLSRAEARGVDVRSTRVGKIVRYKVV